VFLLDFYLLRLVEFGNTTFTIARSVTVSKLRVSELLHAGKVQRDSPVEQRLVIELDCWGRQTGIPVAVNHISEATRAERSTIAIADLDKGIVPNSVPEVCDSRQSYCGLIEA
jgi:hypothetical protein